MIECLSNPNWINPQIDFLIFLENIRVNCSPLIDKLFLSITIFGEFWLPTLICAIIYWCIDYKIGLYLFFLNGFNILFSNFFKMMGCVYRPWVINNNLHPSKLAIPFAKGYSWPSGHSIMSSSVLGGLAFVLRKKKLICSLLILLVLLVGFSRLWLGVHTPQDVLTGFLIGIILVFCVNYIFNLAETDKTKYIYLIITTDILAILALLYICFFNQYPMDYTDGKLLVDPNRYIYLSVISYSYALGILNGSVLCRLFNPYNPKEVPVKTRILRGIIGAIATFLLIKYALNFIVLHTTSYIIAIPVILSIGLFITFIYPLIFTKIENYKK